MLKHEVENFAEYVLYDREQYICICNKYEIAEGIAVELALADPVGDKYHISPIYEAGCLVPGGGQETTIWKDEKGKIRKSYLS